MIMEIPESRPWY